MADGVILTRDDNVGIITLDNPPVNGLSFSVRRGLADQVETAISNDEIKAIIIRGSGTMFCGGADIRQFGKIPPSNTVILPDVINQLEASSKPVVAAIHGIAAGGGLEIALGCHYRLSSPEARIGLPEVTLGFVPGAGGTQRLPRLTGVKNALDLIVSGRLVPADSAHKLGIVDEVVETDLMTRALVFARHLIGQANAVRRTSEQEEALNEARSNPSLFNDFRKTITRRSRGFNAPYACIECIEAAATLPFHDGLAKERELFKALVESDQSKALRHVFFAEREVKKIPDVPKDTPISPVKIGAIIGCGTMGSGIAMNFANAGLPVTIFEATQGALDSGMSKIRDNYAATVSKGRLDQVEMEQRLSLITSTLNYDDVANADIVIEAVFEEIELKKRIFKALDEACKADTILATNTSTLDINEIAAVTSRPDKVIGTHFFSPANVMRLIENVRGQTTSIETIASVMKLSKQLGKIGVLVGVCDGFVGNRMLYAYRRQADFLLEEGALPHQLDKVLYDFGMPMGPFQMADLAGLDIGWQVRQRQKSTRPRHLRYSLIADRLCSMGRFGQKTGAGWYQYEEGSRIPIPDPVVENLIINISNELGIKRRTITDEEVLTRCLYPLVNEGAKILEEGLALRTSDIDTIWVHGYGFPRYRGGPMFWADNVGIKTIYKAMDQLYAKHGDWLKPAQLLAELAQDDRGFLDW